MFNIKITETKADIALFITAFIWGAAILPIKEAVATNTPLTILFWRFFISAVLMGLIAYKFDKFFDKNAIKYGSILGLTLFLGTFFQTTSLKYASNSGIVSFIVSLYILIIPFLSKIIFKKSISLYAYIGVILASTGLYLLQNNLIFGSFEKGYILALCAALALAFHIVLMGFFTKKSELFTFLAAQFFVISVCCLIFSYSIGSSVMPILDYAFYKAMIITIFFSTLIGFGLEGFMLRYTTPIKAAIIFVFKSVTAVILGYFLGGENISLTQLGGICMIMAGILVSEIGASLNKKDKILKALQ